MPRGKYIVIEGTDGTGKSTQADLLAKTLRSRGIKTVQFHEPDGVAIAAELRTIIKNGTLERSAYTNVLLFTAARRENWLQQGSQALESGTWIVSARDYLSTLVYQGYGEGMSLDEITQLTRDATDDAYMNPDVRIILDIVDETERMKRIKKRGTLTIADTFESKDDEFQQKIVAGYQDIAQKESIPIVSAAQSIETMQAEIYALVSRATNL